MKHAHHPSTQKQYLPHTFDIINKNNTRFTRCEIKRLLTPAQESISALIQGRATYDDWAKALGMLSMVQAINDLGVIRGVTGHVEAARLALNCCGHRAAESGEWKSPALTFEERDSLDDIYSLYKTQVEQLTFGEYTRAFNLAKSRLESAKMNIEVADT